MLRQMKVSQKSAGPSGVSSPQKKVDGAAASAAGNAEEAKTVTNTGKSPFRSSNTAGGPSQSLLKSSPKADDDIEEDIVQDHEDIQLQPTSARDPIAASGGASSIAGVDQSIDTLRMEEFDWVEDVKHTPRGDI